MYCRRLVIFVVNMCHDLFWHSMLTLNKPIVYFAKKDDKQNERDLQMHYLYKKNK